MASIGARIMISPPRRSSARNGAGRGVVLIGQCAHRRGGLYLTEWMIAISISLLLLDSLFQLLRCCS